MEFEAHPAAKIFPILQGQAYEELVRDIRENGLEQPIVLTSDNLILDGRNRQQACLDAGVSADYIPWNGEEGREIEYVISLNLHRRHLNESQRAMVAAKVANIGHGGQRANLPLEATTNEDAASMLNVSERSVKTARKVQANAAPELAEAVESGRVSVSAAADVSELPAEEQAEVVARGEKEILAAAKGIRAKRSEVRRQERVANIVEISKGNVELGTDAKYPVIYADPPWRYENPPMGGGNRSIENHYPTMDLAEICALPVADLAADDAILYLWATAPKLAECMQVVEAWGFEYRTCFVWVKDKIGMGYHARNQHELLLVCKRGEIPPPPVEARKSSVVTGSRTEHSVKPVEFYELIESMYPEMPKVELFCREARQGWSVWGNQVESTI